MNKFLLSCSIGFVVGGFLGFGVKTQQAYAQLDEIAENSEATFVSAPSGGGSLGRPQGGACGS